MKKIIKPLASLNLAVFVILLFAALAATGTIVEARYDARAAALLVYHTWWMYSVMALLSVNLIAVMVDRWPWQARHVGFVCAHIGILTIMLGSIITKAFGIDGSMQIGIGEKSQYVTVPETEIVLFSSFNGDTFTKIYSKPVEFFVTSAKENPIKIPVLDGEIEVIDSMRYANAAERFRASQSDRDGAGIRFQIKNANVNLNDWILQRTPGALAEKALGPAKIYLGEHKEIEGENSITIVPLPEDKRKNGAVVSYIVKSKDGRPSLKGILAEGQPLATGWMGLEFKVLNFLPKAKRTWEFTRLEKPNAFATQAILVRYKGEEQWVQLNDILRFFGESSAYVLRFSNQIIDLGVDFNLKDFRIGRYQGTMRAMAYESLVDVPGVGEKLISMNEPLKYKGYTFYQASFTEDETGRPKTSVLSVNYDPGRWIKYLGSLIMCFGIVHLFWFKRRQSRAANKN